MLLKRHYAIFLCLMRSRHFRKQSGGRGMHNAADGSWAWRAADGFAAKALAKTIHDECSVYCRV